MTSYYPHLMFLTNLYVRLWRLKVGDPNVKTRASELKSEFITANLMVALFGIPILVYVKKGERFPYLSELAGLLLHALTAGRAPVPPRPGAYLFTPVVGDE